MFLPQALPEIGKKIEMLEHEAGLLDVSGEVFFCKSFTFELQI